MLKSRDLQRQQAKKNKRNGLTLIVWSDDAKHSQRIQLSRMVLALIIVLIVGVAATIGLLVWHSNDLAAQLQQAQQRSQMDAQREQTMRQVVGKQQQTLDSTRGELATERQKLNTLQSQLGDLEQRIAEIEQFSEQVRTLIGGQTQPLNKAEGGSPDAPTTPTPQSRLLELADPGSDSGYRAMFASYQNAIVADGRRLSSTRDTLEQLQAAYLDRTSAQQADDAKNITAASIEAERQAQERERQRQQDQATAAADAARQAAYNASPHGLPYNGGEFSSYFGWRLSPWQPGKREFHPGLDIVADIGTPVRATGGGRVLTAERNAGYGKYIRIRHSNGLVTLYGHNSRLLVSAGDYVAKGDIIAYSGNTGASTGPHIHYGVYRDGEAQSPLKYP